MDKLNQDVSNLIIKWNKEAQASKYLWRGAAIHIADTLLENGPREARRLLRQQARACKGMAITMSYNSAANELTRILRNYDRRVKND